MKEKEFVDENLKLKYENELETDAKTEMYNVLKYVKNRVLRDEYTYLISDEEKAIRMKLRITMKNIEDFVEDISPTDFYKSEEIKSVNGQHSDLFYIFRKKVEHLAWGRKLEFTALLMIGAVDCEGYPEQISCISIYPGGPQDLGAWV